MTSQAPNKIRVAQDSEGFWTCREATPGSQEYVRADLVADLVALLIDIDYQLGGETPGVQRRFTDLRTLAREARAKVGVAS